jgi:uncharacterized membrane protein YbhN (UPF0104 family)
MHLAPWQAHAACLVLLLADMAARAFRIRWYLTGLGQSLSLAEAFRVNAWGDAAAGLSPMRFGGEIAKLAGLVRARIPMPSAVTALGLEALGTYPLVAIGGALLAVRFAPAWWDAARPALDSALRRHWPLALVIAGIMSGAALTACVWHRRPRAPRPGPLPRRTMRIWPMVAGIPLSGINVVARVLMLPLLALTVPGHPAIGILAFGSFVLLYSQLFLPTPAGAGAVEFGFYAGMAGHFDGAGTAVLVAWRFYTVGAGVLLGLGLTLSTFGVRPLMTWLGKAVARSRPG